MSDVAVRRPGGGEHQGTRYHLPCLGGGWQSDGLNVAPIDASNKCTNVCFSDVGSKPSITGYSQAVSLFSTRTEDIQRSVIQRFTLPNSETNSVSSTSAATTSLTKTAGSCRSVLLKSVLLTEAANIACRYGIHAVTLDHVVDTVGVFPAPQDAFSSTTARSSTRFGTSWLTNWNDGLVTIAK